VFNSGTESIWNSPIFAFSLLLSALVQNYSFVFQIDCKGIWMLPFVSAVISLLYCIYLIQSLHHNLLDSCKYIMMESSLWHMVHTRTFEDAIPDIPEGYAGCRCGQSPRGNAPPPPPHAPVSLEQLLVTQNDLMRLTVWLNARNLDTKSEIPCTQISY
jgi:hypothetical protein